MIKTVIFDIDNTLYSFDKAHGVAFDLLQQYAEDKLGIERDAFACMYREAMHKSTERMGEVAATHNRGIRVQNIMESLRMPLYPYVLEMESLYWDTLLQEMVPFDGVSETMCTLKERGIRIGIGTNMTTRIQLQKLTLLDVLQYVDFFVSSEEAGVDKPALQFFDYCMIKANCERSECLFVGDDFKRDVMGAKNAGLKPVWFWAEESEKAGSVPVIREMKQLLDVIEAEC